MVSENFKIIQEKENSLLDRKEVKLILESKTNPTTLDSEKLISERFSKPVENIAIKGINGKFGRNTFLIEAHIYNSPNEKIRTESKQKTKKKKKEGAK